MITGKIHPIIPLPPAPKIERERNNDVIWTPGAIAWIRDAWITGLSAKAIADRFGQGVTKNHIVGVKSRNPGFGDRGSPIIRQGDGRAAADVPRCRQVGARPTRAPKVTLPPVATSKPGALTAQLVGSGAWNAGMDEEFPREEPVVVLLREVPVRVTPVVVFKPRAASACCFPIGDPGTKGFRFCDDTAVSGRPYCDEHCATAYSTWRREGAAA